MPQLNQLHDYPWWVNIGAFLVIGFVCLSILYGIYLILKWVFLGVMWLLFRNGPP